MPTPEQYRSYQRYLRGVHGDRPSLRMGGVPVGQALQDRYMPCRPGTTPTNRVPACPPAKLGGSSRDGSIIVIFATNAPLMPHQLKRMSKRAALGLGRMGSISEAGSGDIFLAFSTANSQLQSVEREVTQIAMFPNEDLTPFFAAAVDATEEAILNALVAAHDMVGVDGIKAYGLPHAKIREILSRYPSASR